MALRGSGMRGAGALGEVRPRYTGGAERVYTPASSTFSGGVRRRARRAAVGWTAVLCASGPAFVPSACSRLLKLVWSFGRDVPDVSLPFPHTCKTQQHLRMALIHKTREQKHKNNQNG